MELAQPKTTVWTLLRPVYWILKFLGLAAFSIDGEFSNGRIRTTFWDIIWMSMCLLGLFNSLYVKTIDDIALSHTDSFLIDKGAYLVGIFNSFNVICGVVIFVLRKQDIWKLFRKLHKIDVEV